MQLSDGINYSVDETICEVVQKNKVGNLRRMISNMFCRAVLSTCIINSGFPRRLVELQPQILFGITDDFSLIRGFLGLTGFYFLP